MDRNLAGETSHRFSPTLTESASIELEKLQESINCLQADKIYQDNRITKIEHKITEIEKIAYENDNLYSTLDSRVSSIDDNIISLDRSVEVFSDILFKFLMFLPIRILNWFVCFAKINVTLSTVRYKECDVHMVLIIWHPLNMSPNLDKKTIRALNKLSYQTLSKIKKSGDHSSFRIVLVNF